MTRVVPALRASLTWAIVLFITSAVACDQSAPRGAADPTFDEDLDPALLDELYGAADAAAACAEHPGGSLSGDDLLTIVNKEEPRQLRDDWEPSDLIPIHDDAMMPGREGLARLATAQAFYELSQAARDEADLELRVRSAYRSFATQCYTFNYKVETSGLEHASRYSARPGRSEHQLGTALDITSATLDWALTSSMGNTPEGRWLEENAHRFGFALSYPAGQEAFTGYGYEPWHWRYIGVEAAGELHAAGLTLLEYLLSCATGDDEALGCPREQPPVLEPNTGFIGGRCEGDEDCESIGEGAFCLNEAPYVDGSCTLPCDRFCPDRPGLNTATFCVVEVADATTGLCHSRCDFDLFSSAGCREGYSCEVASRPNEGGTAPVCLPPF